MRIDRCEFYQLQMMFRAPCKTQGANLAQIESRSVRIETDQYPRYGISQLLLSYFPRTY